MNAFQVETPAHCIARAMLSLREIVTWARAAKQSTNRPKMMHVLHQTPLYFNGLSIQRLLPLGSPRIRKVTLFCRLSCKDAALTPALSRKRERENIVSEQPTATTASWRTQKNGPRAAGP